MEVVPPRSCIAWRACRRGARRSPSAAHRVVLLRSVGRLDPKDEAIGERPVLRIARVCAEVPSPLLDLVGRHSLAWTRFPVVGGRESRHPPIAELELVRSPEAEVEEAAVANIE